MCIRAGQRGISLIELIMFIVIVSVALAGILLVMNVTTKSSADPLVRKQALAVAESLLEEIQLQDFNSADGTNTTVTSANRSTDYHVVRDYDGLNMAGISSMAGDAVAGLSGYSARVAVADAALGTVAAGSAVLITVTVDHPLGDSVQLSGYRTAY
ncbi:MAG: type II secretion system protein [Gallionella sp.]